MAISNEKVIQVQDLTKIYGKEMHIGPKTLGRKVVGVKDVSFTINKGEIFGFLGPNGAGKTTTIRSILGYLNIQGGSIKVLNLDYKNDALEIRKNIGYLPGDVALYENFTGMEIIEYFGNFRPIDRKFLKHLRSIFKADLTLKIKDLSKGNRQQAAIIATFSSNPDLFILDEPSSGLDPLMTARFHELLLKLRDEGKTIFLSSHDLAEVQAICDRVGIIRQGQMVVIENVKNLRKKNLQVLNVEFKDIIKAPNEKEFKALSSVVSVEKNDGGWRVKVSGKINEILSLISPHKIVRCTIEDLSLEEIFLEYYKDAKEVGGVA